tara:strand:+ start:1483 stop:2490 length:1008 start_codon:yes stop_codon:yes gene_type:complete
MSNFASGKKSKAISDRSGQAFPYDEMRKEWNGSFVHFTEFETKHPQLEPKVYKGDAQGLQNARPDRVEPAVAHMLSSTALSTGPRDSEVININDPGHGFSNGDRVRFRKSEPHFPPYPQVSHIDAHDVNYAPGHIVTKIDNDNFSFNPNDVLTDWLTANCNPGTTTVYLDMDGVVTEYYNAIAAFATAQGLLQSGGDWYNLTPAIELAAIAAVPTTFFQNLAKRAETDALVDLIIAKNGSYEILSTTTSTNMTNQKNAWIAANLTGARAPAANNYATNFNKGPFGGANKLLIDDRTEYINQFEAAGGLGFKYFESGGIRRFGGREVSVGPVSLIA